DYGSYLHVWMYNLSEFNSSNRQIWMILESEIALYEYTEYTGSSDSCDILFDSTGNLLEVSRILVQLRYVGASNQSRAMRILRNIAKSSTIKTGVYADFFQFAEQYNAILPGTLSTIAIASFAVITVSLLLIPKTVTSFWITSSIITDERIDSFERMRNALYNVGVPIVQSASSTIIGVSFLASIDSYIFRSFLKTIILVITIGALHGLLILPILLTLFSNDEKTT
ncbi:unnamed protein product, partial [Onchocerca ochengi]